MTRDERESALERLLAVIRRLRGPQGCPWDREQTIESLRPYLIEEAYEVLEAIDSGESAKHCEELGDVLLQILLHAQIRDEHDDFDFADIMNVLRCKLVRRHPHVFGDVRVSGTDDVLRNWEGIKAKERQQRKGQSAVHGIPAALPALQRAQRVQSRASRVGFDWDRRADVLAKVREEVDELEVEVEQADAEKTAEELGDILFSVVNLCRFHKVDAEDALRRATAKFVTRFQKVEQRVHDNGAELRDCTIEQLEDHWQSVKRDMHSAE